LITRDPRYIKAAEFIGIHHSYIGKNVKKNNFLLGEGFLVYKSFIDLVEIINSEAYQ